MRLALVTDGLFPISVGGMQSHSTNLARHLAASGVAVELFYPASADLSPAEVASRTGLQSEEIRLTPIPWPAVSRFPGHYVRELRKYSEDVRTHLAGRTDIDGIYVQGLCGLAFFSGPKSPSAPVALNLHGLEMFQRSPSARSSLEQLLLRPPARASALNADYVISLGGGITRILESLGVAPSKITEIPVGIDDDWVVDLPRPVHAPRRLLFVGRFERRKGVAELTDTITRLIKIHEFEFHFVGPIPADRQIASPKVKYWGTTSDRNVLRQIMDDCDVIVCPSYAEGMPTVILEGMSRGLAVVATNVGAVDELVSSENGWLIPPAGTDALRAAISDALSISDEELYGRKAASLSRMGGKFRWDQVAKATAAVFGKPAG